MTQRGGEFDKIGNWFEESAVVLHLLRVLWETAESVTWELKHADGNGIDYIVKEHGQTIDPPPVCLTS